MIRFSLALFGLLLISRALVGQTYSVNISTPGINGAIYSNENWISKTPFNGEIDMERFTRLFVLGENGLFHEISEDELKTGKPLSYSIESSSVKEFEHIVFNGIDSENTISSFISINGVSNSTGFKKDEYDAVCRRFVDSKSTLSKDGKGTMELIGTYLSADARFKFTSQYDKFYSAFCKVRWKLVDTESGTTIFEEEVMGGYYFGKINRVKVAKMYEDQNYSAKKAVVSSLNELLRNKDFVEATESVINPAKLEFDEPLLISAKAQYASSVEESLEATITVQTSKGFGSGFIVSDDGYILTNSHVINDVEHYTVILPSGMSVKAELIRNNPTMDIALLKVPLEGLPSLEIQKENKLNIGDEIFAIGTPENVELGQSLTKGIVSGLRGSERNLIQSDVSINKGNSGGPMLDSNYKVVGIITAKLIGVGTEGVGFAIPIEDALESVNVKISE